MFRPLYMALIFFTLIAISIGFATAAQAQVGACSDRDSMVRTLIDQYSEAQAGGGLDVNGKVFFELWVSLDTGTWTILRSYPNGTACVDGVGEGWVFIAPPVEGEAS